MRLIARQLVIAAFLIGIGCRPASSGFKHVRPEIRHVSPMLEARSNHAALLLRSGNVLIMGGERDNGWLAPLPLASVELYDSRREVWRSMPRLVRARSLAPALLWKETPAVVGGIGQDGEPLASIEAFIDNAWQEVAKLRTARFGHSVVELPSHRLLVFGGRSGSETLSSVESCDLESQSCQEIGRLEHPRAYHASVLREDGSVLVAGGQVSSAMGAPIGVQAIELWPPLHSAAVELGQWPWAYGWISAERLPNGVVLLLGGREDESKPPRLMSVGVKNDVVTGLMVGDLIMHRSVYVPSDGIWIVGGRRGENLEVSSLVLRMDEGRLSIVGKMSAPRFGHSATCLLNGNVLIAGGYSHTALNARGVTLASAELIVHGSAGRRSHRP
jgi:hypothetical protein